MSMIETSKIINDIKKLIVNIDEYVPNNGKVKNIEFRSDLTGLLIVSTIATYENCIKEIIISYADTQHAAFGRYADLQYKKLNSNIKLHNLNSYAKKLGEDLQSKFQKELLKAEKRINPTNSDFSKHEKFDIVKAYHELLDCRHSFAHARIRTKTIDDATQLHKKGKFVVLCFAKALSI